MTNKLPTGKVGRTLSGGYTAAKVGGKVLTYYAKRPFLSSQSRHQARERMALKGAQTLFQGLSLLRGTALKMAQQLSLEMDILPEAACRELAKSYHQVPPINRALVRKVIQGALGKPPEAVFKSFDLKAFAAASLGQVHYAVTMEDEPLAVKIQYPGIAKTIDSDVALLRQMLRPLMQSDHLIPTLEEVAERLREEVDYLQEADNLIFFYDHLNLDGVRTPEIFSNLSAPTVISTSLMPGMPLDAWLQTNPDQEAKDHVAQTLNDLFIEGLYKLNVIHADPNPGNFIIADDLSIGLVDFGCVKRLDPGFVESYRQLCITAAHGRKKGHFEQMIDIGIVQPDLGGPAKKKIQKITDDVGHWYGKMYAKEYFDFSLQKEFVAEGKAMMSNYHQHRKHLSVNPEIIFLDRTRYGLIRIFEMMEARVKFRNSYEW